MDTGNKALQDRDLAEALRISGGARDLADELYAQFLAELPGYLKGIRQLLEDRKDAPLRDLLHQLKGGAAVCAVKAFLAILDELHRAVKAGDWGRAGQLAGELETCADRLLRAGVN